MSLIEPGIGLIFWMSIAFIIVWGLLGKFAWKPILKSIKEREQSIEEALQSSADAKQQVAKLDKEIEQMKKDARLEREKLLEAAEKKANEIVSKAQEDAKKEGEKIIVSAYESIENERKAAVAEIKNQVARFSLEISSKLLEKNLTENKEQKHLVAKLLADFNFN